ncbi:MAG: DUF485 domain-containing protein [Lysobacterales bacterium]|nr:MAG: DUF485 domain-containing protein [Xanthomonadales bacterium]
MTREHEPPNTDLTPHTGSATDVAPLGRSKAKPPHEQTAEEDRDEADWEQLAASAEFKALLKAKAKFIVPATVFFIVYYFSLPLLVGYAPELMARKVFGVVNIAYLFALSQFFMAWILAWAYVRAAGRFDKMARAVIDQGK